MTNDQPNNAQDREGTGESVSGVAATSGYTSQQAYNLEATEPRYGTTDDGTRYCQDCGVAVIDRHAHNRFHSVLASHGWVLAVLKNAHLSERTHDRYDAVERINRKRFDNWSADALAEVMEAMPDGS